MTPASLSASRAVLWIVPAVVALLALAIWWTVGRALQPVRATSTQVAAISGSILDERVPEPASEDEIAELADLMNQMLDRLRASADRQRAFVSDASHELRSPLSTIAASAKIAQTSDDPQKLQQLASKISTEAQQMHLLIIDLLDLTRMDEDRQSGQLEVVDVGAVCHDVCGRMEALGVDIVVDVDGTEPVQAAGVTSQIDRVILNLVDNASSYATTAVKVSARSVGTTAEISVEDNGPGEADGDREQIFERFVRLDESRERRSGGTGIGLALVKAIVDRHNGTVSVEDSVALGGALFRVGLPIRYATNGKQGARV